jgi:putative membrane protein
MSTVESVLPYINEFFIISSAVVMGIGWYFIRRRNVEVHRRLMLTGSILAALFFITYVLKTLIYGDTMFGGPDKWKSPYQLFLQMHSILATVAAIMGIITLRFAFKANFQSHRKLGPWTVSTWFITAVTGLAVFLLLYVIFPPGPTTNMFNAWLGN